MGACAHSHLFEAGVALIRLENGVKASRRRRVKFDVLRQVLGPRRVVKAGELTLAPGIEHGLERIHVPRRGYRIRIRVSRHCWRRRCLRGRLLRGVRLRGDRLLHCLRCATTHLVGSSSSTAVSDAVCTVDERTSGRECSSPVSDASRRPRRFCTRNSRSVPSGLKRRSGAFYSRDDCGER